ncbi:MAG: PKD domain-containing protein [Fluviicola sp.]|nr:PKD domain-containing protein [Fluviicola sp.]
MNKLICFIALFLGVETVTTAQCTYQISASDTTLCAGDSIVLSTTGAQQALTTTLGAGNNHRGNMFDIVATNTVTITGFDAHPMGNTTIEIYYRPGTFVGFESNSAGWTLVGSVAITAQPYGTATPIPLNVGVTIPAGQTYSFYVTSTNTSVSLNYSNGSSVGAVFASDANIQFLQGKGMEYPFASGGAIFSPRVFNGIIHYELPLQYAWSTGETTQSITVAPAVDAMYSVEVTDAINLCSNTDSINLIVNQLPAVDIENNPTICLGNSVVFDAGFPGSSYSWNTGDTTQTISVNSADTIEVMVTDINGCVGYDTSVTSVVDYVIDLGNDTTLCDGGAVLLNPGNGASFSWSTGDTIQSINVNTSGTYVVVATSIDGCLDTSSVVVDFLALPVVELLADTTICNGSELALDANNAGDTFLWNTGDTAQVILVATAGTYGVTVTNADGCEATDEVVVDLLDAPVANFTQVITSVTSNFTDNSTNATSWMWNFGDGNTSTNQNPSHTYAASGTYTVVLVATNDCGNDTTSTQITVNGVGLSELQLEQSINVFPNPNNGNFTVELTNTVDKDVAVSVVDVLGNVLYNNAFGAQTNFQINLVDQLLAGGIYFLEITIDNTLISKRIVINK